MEFQALSMIGELFNLSSESSPSSTIASSHTTLSHRSTRVDDRHHDRKQERIVERRMNSSLRDPTWQSAFLQWQSPNAIIDSKEPNPNSSRGTVSEQTNQNSNHSKLKERLQTITLLEGHRNAFQKWCSVYQSHKNCCNAQTTSANDFPVIHERMLPCQFLESQSPKHEFSKCTREDLQSFLCNQQAIHLSEIETSITESICWRNCPSYNSPIKTRNDEKDNTNLETLYVNFTNYILPGYGFTGHVPSADLALDDSDELEVFWNTNLSLYLHPQNPTIQSKKLYPLQQNDTLFCPKVCIYAHQDDQCCSRRINISNVPLPLKKSNSSEDSLNESKKQKQLFDSITKEQLTIIFRHILSIAERNNIKQIIIPLGRFIKLNVDTFVLGHVFCQMFLRAMKRKEIHTVELVISNKCKSSTSDRWVQNLMSILKSYISS
jgi:hypothetical protein